jgi:hypothetical protein
VDEGGTPIDTRYVMRADASPAIASSPLGGWLTAWVDDANFLCQLDQSGAYRRSGNGLGVRAGTNPSVGGAANGNFLLAFQGADGNLWTVTDGGAMNATGIAMAANSSPSVTATIHGYFIGYQASDGLLWVLGADGRAVRAGNGFGLAPGTSPCAYPHPQGTGYEVAFHGNDGAYWILDHAGSVHWASNGLGIWPGSNPAVAARIGSAVNSAPPTTTVPALTGQDVKVATSALYTAGLTGTVKYIVDCNNLGVVLGQSPAAGAVVAQSSTVTLTVGATPKQVDPKSTRVCP